MTGAVLRLLVGAFIMFDALADIASAAAGNLVPVAGFTIGLVAAIIWRYQVRRPR